MVHPVDSLVAERLVQHAVSPVREEVFRQKRKDHLPAKFEPGESYGEGRLSRSVLGFAEWIIGVDTSGLCKNSLVNFPLETLVPQPRNYDDGHYFGFESGPGLGVFDPGQLGVQSPELLDKIVVDSVEAIE